MPLGDMENLVLSTLRQPGSGFSTGSSTGYPDWGSLTQAKLGQAQVDNAINVGYRRACVDLQYIRASTSSFGIFSQIGIGSYPIPPPQPTNPYPAIIEVLDVIYAPSGFVEQRRYRPGQNLVGWDEFQKLCGQSRDRTTAQAVFPSIMCVRDRTTLELYPAPMQAQDLLTVTYSATPTAGSIDIMPLAQPTDRIALPEDAEWAIVCWACSVLFPNMGDMQSAADYRQQYAAEIARLKVAYARQSSGDALIIDDADYSYSAGWML